MNMFLLVSVMGVTFVLCVHSDKLATRMMRGGVPYTLPDVLLTSVWQLCSYVGHGMCQLALQTHTHFVCNTQFQLYIVVLQEASIQCCGRPQAALVQESA